jgi:hypothetical protein
VPVISELPARWSRLIARFLESGHDLPAVPGVSGISVFAAYGVPQPVDRLDAPRPRASRAKSERPARSPSRLVAAWTNSLEIKIPLL